MSKNETTMREALQHIAAGHDVVCLQCWWTGMQSDTGPSYECPKCQSGHTRIGADEIADYALRQIEGGGE